MSHDKVAPYLFLASAIILAGVYFFFGDSNGCIAEVSKDRPCFYLQSEGGLQKICTGDK